MVNKYKRKTEQATWCETAMKNAMKESETTAVSAASKKYGIPLSTLQRHLKKGSCSKNLGGYRRVFKDEQEAELLQYVFQVDYLFYSLTKNEFFKLVYEYAERNNIVHPFKNSSVGNDWYLGFKKRHSNIVVRQPEPTSIARARGFNRPQVCRFYDLLEREIDKHDIDPTRIYNMDETGIHASSNKFPKILSKSGEKQVGVISRAERGKSTTVICCCNAAGSFIPPFLIMVEKECDALEYARKNNVIFVSLPPQTTDRRQPLDGCVYGPFKTCYEKEVLTFQRSHVGRIITQYDVASLVGKAYLKAASAQNAVQGFKSSGIWPTERHIFSDADFLPASLTDRAEVIENTNDSPSHIQSINAGRLSNNSDSSTSTSVFENVDHIYSQASRISLRPQTKKLRMIQLLKMILHVLRQRVAIHFNQ
nr:uncharacterized protein LOC107445205 [Parasteatoda tepidariorum]